MKSVGVLTADAVTGPYTFASPCFKPDGQDSYDMGTYLDLDQTHPNGASVHACVGPMPLAVTR